MIITTTANMIDLQDNRVSLITTDTHRAAVCLENKMLQNSMTQRDVIEAVPTTLTTGNRLIDPASRTQVVLTTLPSHFAMCQKHGFAAVEAARHPVPPRKLAAIRTKTRSQPLKPKLIRLFGSFGVATVATVILASYLVVATAAITDSLLDLPFSAFLRDSAPGNRAAITTRRTFQRCGSAMDAATVLSPVLPQRFFGR